MTILMPASKNRSSRAKLMVLVTPQYLFSCPRRRSNKAFKY